MNKEMANRIKTAGEYQKKAIYALFPENVSGHLDVIEKEIKMMAVEMAAGILKEYGKSDTCEKKENHEKASGVKKVDIV